MRYRATASYDGSGYEGWQSQSGRGPTVQEAIERALAVVLRQTVRVASAGRTDGGVHARGQVIAFDVADEILDRPRALYSINAILPPDIALRDLEATSPEFDPRRDAIQRAYAYRIWNSPTREPLERHTSWHVPWPLCVTAMSAAAAHLIGEKDFASFQASDNVARARVRTVTRSAVERSDDLIVYRIEANSFARRMVRNIVGQLVEVGLGRSPADAMPDLLARRDRSLAAPPAPPHGLCLEWVRYR